MPEITIKPLKTEFCRFEEGYQNLRVRIKIDGVYDLGNDNLLTAFITNKHGMEFALTEWEETISDTTEKLIKEYDLNDVYFTEQDINDNIGNQGTYDNVSAVLPLNIGKNLLTVNINDTTTSIEFDLVPITTATFRGQYLLGVDMEAANQLAIQQELRKITGVEITEISKDTTVGAKNIVWNHEAQTLQWDNGIPVSISDDYIEYKLYDYTMIPGTNYGDYISITVEDPEDLPAESVSETVLVDVKRYSAEDYQYWVNQGYQTTAQTIANVPVEPTLYSSDKDLVTGKNYIYLEPSQLTPKRFTRTLNTSFEFPVNKLQRIIEIWGLHGGSHRVNIDKSHVKSTSDGRVTVEGYPIGARGGNAYATIGAAGLYDRTINAENYPGSRNPVAGFWNGTVIAGVIDEGIRDLYLQVSAQISAINALLQAGLGQGEGIASRSFSVDGVSSSYQTTESAENSLFSGVITDLQKGLGVGKASKEEKNTGLVNQLRKKIEGGSLAFKY